jgi:DNA-binding IclR family transcriptional regulator
LTGQETLALETFVQSGARAATLQSILNLGNSALFRALSQLMRAGYVTQAQRGDPYYITQRGKAAV